MPVGTDLHAALGAAVLCRSHLVVVVIVPRGLQPNAVVMKPVVAVIT